MKDLYGKYKLPFRTNKRLDKPSGKDAARLCFDRICNLKEFKEYPFQVIQNINNHISIVDDNMSGVGGLSAILLACSALFAGLSVGSFFRGDIEGGGAEAIISAASGWGTIYGYRSEQACKRAKKLASYVRERVTDALANR